MEPGWSGRDILFNLEIRNCGSSIFLSAYHNTYFQLYIIMIRVFELRFLLFDTVFRLVFNAFRSPAGDTGDGLLAGRVPDLQINASF